MRLLFLTFYFRPDLSAGSFRATALVESLDNEAREDLEVEVITTQPNRYESFREAAPSLERFGKATTRRIPTRTHTGGLLDQTLAFISYALPALRYALRSPCDGVFATSSRLFTATLGAVIARIKGVPLYLDVRDIFVESVEPLLPRPVAMVAMPILRGIERFTIRTARKVNLVSEGFREYFERRYPETVFGFIPNGVDDEFLDSPQPTARRAGIKTILYAGNIGEGQGLHHVVPQISAALPDEYEIVIVGDGGRREALERAIGGMPRVRLVRPVRRDQLRQMYANAAVLFLHLNDLPAFQRVLPSKLFEYAATGKPILAGLSGYSARFVQENIENAEVFPPCDGPAAIRALGRLDEAARDRSDFVARFARRRLSSELASDVLTTLS